MKYVKLYWKYVLLLIILSIFSVFFPVTNKDWAWSLKDNTDLISYFILSKGNILISSITVLLTHFNITKAISYSIITFCIFILMRNIVNKKNNTLFYIAIFLFMILNTDIFFLSYVSISGFCYHFIPLVFLLIIMWYLINDNLYKLNRKLIFILGLVSSSLSPYLSITLLLVLCILIIKNIYKKEKDIYLMILFEGVIIGSMLLLTSFLKSGTKYILPDVSNNILHILIPKINNINFLITLISIAFILYLSIKVYIKGNSNTKNNVILCIGAITIYSMSRLLSKNAILNYIMFIFYTVSSIYILLNSNNSIRFKTRIKMYYLFKFTYILTLAFTPNIFSSHMIPIAMLDMLIILELINYVFPKNFLEHIWFGITIAILLINIYVYKNIYFKNREINDYIKHNLECGFTDIQLPQRYKTSYREFLLPQNSNENMEYVFYLNINNKGDYNIYFSE